MKTLNNYERIMGLSPLQKFLISEFIIKYYIGPVSVELNQNFYNLLFVIIKFYRPFQGLIS